MIVPAHRIPFGRALNHGDIEKAPSREGIFYRRAVLACGGSKWHHVAFDYPAEEKSNLEPVVSRTARALDESRGYGCDDAASSRP